MRSCNARHLPAAPLPQRSRHLRQWCSRRQFLRGAGGLALAGLLTSCANPIRSVTRARVVVIGGGYGGATAAKYLALWSAGTVDVTLVEANRAFVSCPLSNLVIAGSKTLDDITVNYDGLGRLGVRVVHDTATAVDVEKRSVRLERGDALPFDRLIVSPGIDFFFDRVGGLGTAAARARVPHAWKAGAQTLALRAQLEAMHDGGVFALSVPRAPLRCPPGPYERACQVAWYLKRTKPRSKVLVLDGNDDVQSKKALFTRAWAEEYRGMVEYRPDYVLTEIDTATLTARFETAEDVRADVFNVIPPHGAGSIARQAGVVTANDQWCEVDFLTYESRKVPGVHVLGDAIQVAPLMPKSGHMANQHGKVAASAILALFAETPVNSAPVMNNTCYSFLTDRAAAHVASVHQYDANQKTMLSVPGAGGVSQAMSIAEGEDALAWAHAIWGDMLT